jgi:hypothetical protein
VTDVLVVSLGSTGGWRASDAEFAAAIERTGASAAVATAQPQRDVRTYALTDFVWARAARAAAQRGIDQHAPRGSCTPPPRAAGRWRSASTLARDSRPGRMVSGLAGGLARRRLTRCAGPAGHHCGAERRWRRPRDVAAVAYVS